VIKKIPIAVLLISFSLFSIAQDSSHINQKRLWVAGAANATLIGGSLLVLNSA
jgi:hypothetical protein